MKSWRSNAIRGGQVAREREPYRRWQRRRITGRVRAPGRPEPKSYHLPASRDSSDPDLMVPMFLVLKTLGWVNQLIGIIVPPAGTPTGTLMMRQFIRGIPDEMIEAARLDGASNWKIYRHIILPLCAPMSAALGIVTFTWRWNGLPLVINCSEQPGQVHPAIGAG